MGGDGVPDPGESRDGTFVKDPVKRTEERHLVPGLQDLRDVDLRLLCQGWDGPSEGGMPAPDWGVPWGGSHMVCSLQPLPSMRRWGRGSPLPAPHSSSSQFHTCHLQIELVFHEIIFHIIASLEP